MNETRYLISETAKITQVEPHVLRYWEEELGLAIGRNEMGHRYYTEKDIHIFMTIKELKKKGLQLRAIRTIIQEEDQDMEAGGIAGSEDAAKQRKAEAEHHAGGVAGQPIIKLQEKRQEKFRQQAQGKLSERCPESRKAKAEESVHQVKQTPERAEGQQKLSPAAKTENKSVKSKEERFGEIMERLIHDIELGERKEGRYRRLDEAIRKHQQSRKMVAATEENVKRKKKRKAKSKKI